MTWQIARHIEKCRHGCTRQSRRATFRHATSCTHMRAPALPLPFLRAQLLPGSLLTCISGQETKTPAAATARTSYSWSNLEHRSPLRLTEAADARNGTPQRKFIRICATKFIWSASSRVTTTHYGCAASWRLYFGRGMTDDDLGRSKLSAIYLFIERDTAAKSFREMIIQHRAHKRKKSNKNITVLKIKCNTLDLPPFGYSLGRLTYNTRVHKMADTLTANPALSNF